MELQKIINRHVIKNLEIDEDMLNNLMYNKITYLEEEDENIREKIFIWKTYYNFLNNKTCINFLNNSYNLIKKYIEKEKKEYIILLKDDVLISMLIICLKSNISFKNLADQELNFNSDFYINYCTENFIKYCIFNKIHMKEKHIKQIYLMIFNILADNDIIKIKKISTYDNKTKTILMYIFQNINYSISDEEFLNFSFSPFNLIEYDNRLFSSTHHFSKVNEMCKKNFFSGKNFEPKNISYINKKINLKLYIDEDFNTNDLNLRNKEKILEEIYEIYNELKKKYDETNWTAETKNDISNIQKKYSSLITEYTIKIFTEQKIKFHIYIPIFLDFRGRKYYNSIVGPTQSKILRTAYFYGYYTKEDFKNIKPWERLLKYSDKIKKICNDNNFEMEEYFYDIYYWCIIGIGKFLINKNKIPIEEIEFIEKAEEFFKNYKHDLKTNDILEIKNYIRIMKSLTKENLEKGLIKKRVIIKDATASVNQILMKKLGPLNQNSMNYINLGEKNEWYDTYLIHKEKFIEDFKKNYKEYSKFITNYSEEKIIEWIEEVLPRNLIKKIIMIIPYSAGFRLCWKNYVDQIKENKYKIVVNKDLKNLLKLFYNFIKNDMQDMYLYKKKSSYYFDKVNEEFEIKRKYVIETETGYADISYYKMKKKSIEKRYISNEKIKRLTKLILEITSALDIKSFNSSSAPNITHFYDADEIREIEIAMNKVFITIHDCYLVDILSCTDLIRTKQLHYNKWIFGYQIKNIFILL